MADKPKKGMGTFGKVFVGLLLIVVLVGVAGVGYGFSLDASKTFARSTVIKADESDIHKYVADLKQWETWGPWKEMDPTMTWEYSEKTDEKGSWTKFTGKDGSGKVELTSVDKDKGVEYLFTWEDYEPQKGAFRYAEDKDGVKVTWQAYMEMGSNILGRYMLKFGESHMNEMFDQGLAGIKTKAEAE